MLKRFIVKPLLFISLILALLAASVPIQAASINVPNDWAADVIKGWSDRSADGTGGEVD